MEHVNVDFKFDFQSAIKKAYDEHYQEIADIAKGIDLKALSTEKAVRQLISINSSVLSKVLEQYNYDLLNEI